MASVPKLPPAELAAELRGETLLWSGSPDADDAEKRATFTGVFGFFFFCFAALWTAGTTWGMSTVQDGGPLRWLFPLPGVAFMAFGVMLFFAPLRAKRAAPRTLYAVTPTRILVVPGDRRPAVSIGATAIAGFQRVLRGNGLADVRFSYSGVQAGLPLHFMSVSDIDGVEAALRQLLRP